MAKELLKRSEVKEEFTWNLKDMYASDEAWEEELKTILAIVAELAQYEGKVTASAKNLLTVLEKEADFGQRLELAFNYAERIHDQDQKNATHQAMNQKMYALYADVSSKTAFVVPEILETSEEVLEGYFKELPELELYRKQIAEISRRKAHTLSKEAEKLIAATGEMQALPDQVFSVLNNADFVFPTITDENGETVRITHGNFIPFLECADRRG